MLFSYLSVKNILIILTFSHPQKKFTNNDLNRNNIVILIN